VSGLQDRHWRAEFVGHVGDQVPQYPVLLVSDVGGLVERSEQLAQELVDSVLAGSGQFCTSPNLLLVFETAQTTPFLAQIAKSFTERPAQPLLSAAGRKQLHQGVAALTTAGAQLVTGGDNAPGEGYRFANTLLRTTAAKFLAAPHDLQREVWDLAVADQVASAMGELPEEERRAIELAYFDGHTYREVAQLLDQPEGTIKSRIRNGMRRMRAVLADAGVRGVDA